jgi:hypothetical protein
MDSKVAIIQGKHHKIIDFKDADETSITEYMDTLMGLLLSGEKSVLCKNMNLSDKEILEKISKSVERCYKKKHPLSILSPKLELYDPAGDDVYYVASLHRKLL